MVSVSVVIPCFNLGAYLDEAVDSVLAQRFEDYEIIVVNDGSTDAETLDRLAAQEAKPKTTVLHTENQGLPATRNYGIERARGRYISCLDADDRFHKDFLGECIPVLERDSAGELGFVTTTVKVFGAQRAYWYCSDYDPVKLLVENVVHAASLFRRTCWDEVGGYACNLSGFQDWNFWIAIVAEGYRWSLVKRPLFQYRDREGSMIKTSETKRRDLKATIVANHLEFFREHVAGMVAEYETQIAEIRRQSHERENEVAQLSLEKLKSLFAAYEGLEARCTRLERELAAARSSSS